MAKGGRVKGLSNSATTFPMPGRARTTAISQGPILQRRPAAPPPSSGMGAAQPPGAGGTKNTTGLPVH